MRKIFCLLLLIITLCGCDGGPLYDVSYPKPVVVEPDEDTRYNINGYKDTSINVPIQSESANDSSVEQTEERLIGNKKSKMLHKSGCSYIKNLKDENTVLFDSPDEAIFHGYSKCSRCFK